MSKLPIEPQDSIEARLVALERSLRHWRLATSSLIVACVAVGITSFSGGPKDLTVRSLTVVNAKGKVTGKLETIDTRSGGFGSLDLYGENGVNTIYLRGMRGYGAIYIRDENDSLRFIVGMEDDNPSMYFFGHRDSFVLIIPWQSGSSSLPKQF